MVRNANIPRIFFVIFVATGVGALGSFAYYLVLKETSPIASWWAALAGVLAIVNGILNLAMLHGAQWLRDAPRLRNAIIVSMPCPLILAGLALIGVGSGSDLVMVLCGSVAVCVFLVGFGLYIRYVATGENRRSPGPNWA